MQKENEREADGKKHTRERKEKEKRLLEECRKSKGGIEGGIIVERVKERRGDKYKDAKRVKENRIEESYQREERKGEETNKRMQKGCEREVEGRSIVERENGR